MCIVTEVRNLDSVELLGLGLKKGSPAIICLQGSTEHGVNVYSGGVLIKGVPLYCLRLEGIEVQTIKARLRSPDRQPTCGQLSLSN